MLKVAALVAWLGENRMTVDRTLVSHWISGRAHLPADILPRLSEFTGRPDLVFKHFVRASNCDIVHIPEGNLSNGKLTHLVLQAGSSLGQLQHAIAEAQSSDSPGGEKITDTERRSLVNCLNSYIQELADLKRSLQEKSDEETRLIAI